MVGRERQHSFDYHRHDGGGDGASGSVGFWKGDRLLGRVSCVLSLLASKKLPQS